MGRGYLEGSRRGGEAGVCETGFTENYTLTTKGRVFLGMFNIDAQQGKLSEQGFLFIHANP